MQNRCLHLEEIREVTPSSQDCMDCLVTGDAWVHLRMCLVCGHVGCCDSWKNCHARVDWRETQHPLIRSVESGQTRRWRCADEVYL
jgi:uncharacterized UBP type Zn finger protein